MAQAQEPGVLDIAFNSSFGIPQQALWRLYRVLEDEDIGLFDEAGFMDMSLVPGLGWFDDHKNDVMPDYMAKELGFSDNIGGHLAAAILTDPLTYFSGGLTTVGHAAKAAKAVTRLKALNPTIRAAAQKAGKTFVKYTDDISPEVLLGHLDEAIKAAPTRKAAKQLTKSKHELTKTLARAGKEAAQKGAKPLDATVGELTKHTNARQIALGLGNFGLGRASYVVGPGYSSWLKYAGATAIGRAGVTKSALGTDAGKAASMFVRQKVLELPAVRATLAEATAPFRNFAGGWKVGGETLADVKAANRTLNAVERHQLSRLYTTQATDLVADIHKAHDTYGPNLVVLITDKYKALIKDNFTHEEAFLKALKHHGVKTKDEGAAAVWGRLTGRGKDSTYFPGDAWGGGSANGAKAISGTLKAAVAQHAEASKLLLSGGVTDVPGKSLLGEFHAALLGDRKKLTKVGQAIAETSFNVGQTLKMTQNKVFVTGSEMQFGKELREQLQSNVARDDNFRDMLADGIYAGLINLAKTDPNFNAQDSGPILRFLMTLDFMPDEVGATFRTFEANPENMDVLKGAINANERLRRGFMVLQEQLKLGEGGVDGITSPYAREALVKLFSDDLFPILDLSSHGNTKEGAFLYAHWERVLEDKYRQVPTPTPEQIRRLEAPHNGHRIMGQEVTSEAGVVSNVMGDLVGKQAGTLTNAELDEGIDIIRQLSQRPLTRAEMYEQAGQMPAIQAFAERHGISTDQVAELLRSKRTTTDRIEDVIDPLWEGTRKNWTTSTMSQHLEPYGLELTELPTGGWVFGSSLGLTAGTLQKHGLKGAGRKVYGTFREAMSDAHTFLDGSPKYRKLYGPKPRAEAIRVPIGAQEMKGLRAWVNQTPEGTQLFRNPTKYDEAYVPHQLTGSNSRLSELRRRRDLDPSHELYESRMVIPTERRISVRAVPSTPDELKVMFHGAGVSIPEDLLTDVAVDYARGRMLSEELAQAYQRAERRGEVLDPSHLLPDLEKHLVSASNKTKDMVLEALGPAYRGVFERAQFLTNQAWKAAQASGTWLPGSPIGYVSRFYTTEQQARAATLIGRIHKEDAGILMRLGVKQAQKFERQLDEFTLDDINAMSLEVQAAAKRTGSPELKAINKDLDDLMEEAGVGIKGFKAFKKAYTGKAFEDDPFLGIIQRLGNAQNDTSLTGYFDKLFELADGTNGTSLMMGGKLVHVIDDTASLDQLRTTQRVTSDMILRSKKMGRVVRMGMDKGEDISPLAYVIETADGTFKVIENNSLMGTGFGILKLRNIEKAEKLGHRPSLGQSFSDSMLRSDVLESIHTKPLTRVDAEGMIGHHVVYGSENMLRGAVKTAADIHRVSGPAARTFDTVNYMIKQFQTIFRLPFAAFNLSSGVFQAHAAGVGPKNIMLGYMDAFRMMFGQQKFATQSQLLEDLIGSSVNVKSWGFVNLFKGDQSRLIKFAEAHSNPNFVEDWAKAHGVEFDSVEDLYYSLSNGKEINLLDVFRQAGERQLYGTHAGSLARGSRTAQESLMRSKLGAIEGGVRAKLGRGDLTGALKDVLPRAMDRTRNLAEETEVWNRTATMFGLIREGHGIDRAIDITKAAHVPYERLTHIERSVIKRFSTYYAFPRHYMPWQWARFMEEPGRMAALGHAIRERRLVDTTEGRPTLVLGDYRIDLGRASAPIEAVTMMAAFADRLAIPFGETLTGTTPNYDRKLTKSWSDGGLLNIGGPLAPFIGGNLLSDGSRSRTSRGTFEEAATMIWPVKVAMQLAGNLPWRTELNPRLEYTEGEAWLTNPVYGFGVRKVAKKHEQLVVQQMFKSEMRKLQLRITATKDPARQKRYMGHLVKLREAFARSIEGMKKRAVK